MPYKNKDEQRKFQAKWMTDKNHAKKQKEREELGEYAFLVDKNRANWEDLSENDNVISKEKLSDWDACVIEAKRFVGKRTTNRLRIANLAVKACEIRHGGVADPDRYTLSMFADAIGVNPKTLSDWVRVKKQIADHLPPGHKFFDMTAARLVFDYDENSRQIRIKDAVAAYLHLISPEGKASRSAINCARYLNSLVYHLRKFGTHGFSEVQKTKMGFILYQVSKLTDEITPTDSTDLNLSELAIPLKPFVPAHAQSVRTTQGNSQSVEQLQG